MATYVAFLRAINLGARRKFPKQAVIDAAEGAGFAEVASHLNTGNVRVGTRMRARGRIESALEEAFEAAAGFVVPTIVLTPAELREVAEAADDIEHDGRHYVSLLKQAPTASGLEAVRAGAGPGERVVATGRAVHLLLDEDYHRARLTNDLVERHLGTATNRNLTVIRTVVDRWC